MSWLALRTLLRGVPAVVWEVLAFVVVGVAVVLYAERLGAQHERARVLDAKIVHDSVTVVRLDTVVKHDTIRLTRTLAYYDTVRASVDVHDTIAVERFIAASDSAVHSCRETVAAFTLSCAAKDTLIASLRARVSLGIAPAQPMTWKVKLGYALAGAALAEAAHRIRP